MTAYSGYLMTVQGPGDTSSLSADPVCMDTSPETVDGYGMDAKAPQLTFVKSGQGLWLNDKLVPCAVCVKSSGF